MHIGDEFSIKLRSNSGTGYSWQLAPGTLDDRIVEFVTETYQAPEGNLIGSSGTEEFVFKAVRDGTTTLTLHYVRPWETDVEPADVHVTEVTVLP
jgi:inhibitor of cysteine peptidase